MPNTMFANRDLSYFVITCDTAIGAYTIILKKYISTFHDHVIHFSYIKVFHISNRSEDDQEKRSKALKPLSNKQVLFFAR